MIPANRTAVALAATAGALVFPTAGHAAIELRSGANGVLTNIPSAGTFDALAAAGDVNGDGLSDVVVGSGLAAPFGRPSAGSAFVIFGRASFGTVDVQAPGAAGFRVDGAAGDREVVESGGEEHGFGDLAGAAAAGLGDVNGDGLGDIAIGAPGSSNNGRRASGSVYVVFGRADAGPIDLAALGEGGFRIDGPSRQAFAGSSVAGPGDVNGDGIPDVLLSRIDGAYLVYGKRSSSPVDLGLEGDWGFAIRGTRATGTGAALAGAGDVDGDGAPDLLVGAPASTSPRERSGAAYVIFGKPDRAPVTLRSLGDDGFRIDGGRRGGYLGTAVAAAGDINLDGRGDVIVGAPGESEGVVSRGEVWVVNGRGGSATVDLGQPGPGAYSVRGPARGDGFGSAVAGVGDLDGDRRPELAIGAPSAEPGCRIRSGATYVTRGGRQGGVLGTGAFRIDGAGGGEGAGATVAALGDLNSDGLGEIAIGAPRPEADGERPWRSYVVFGRLAAPLVRRPAPCLEVRPDRASLRRFRDTGRLVVRVRSRDPGRTHSFAEPLPIGRSLQRRFVGARFREESLDLRGPGRGRIVMRIGPRRVLDRLRRGDRFRIVVFQHDRAGGDRVASVGVRL